MAMKCRVANIIRKEIYKKKIEDFTDKQKIDFFDEIYIEAKKMHYELQAYKSKRQKKAEIQRLREERKNLVK
jgi:hypothetical protein